MSCDDCKKVADMYQDVIDGEVSCEELEIFNKHLEKCAKCAGYVEKEKTLFAEIKAKITAKCCPEKVLNSVLNKIEQLAK